MRAISSTIEKSRQLSMAPGGAPMSADQFQSWNGAAMPRPAIRAACAAGRVDVSAGRASATKSMRISGVG